jgi:hypothetical protein
MERRMVGERERRMGRGGPEAENCIERLEL